MQNLTYLFFFRQQLYYACDDNFWQCKYILNYMLSTYVYTPAASLFNAKVMPGYEGNANVIIMNSSTTYLLCKFD